MNLNHDREITISTGTSRKDKEWKLKTQKVSELLERLKTPIRETVRMAEYQHLTRTERLKIKDHGGFVGGKIEGDGRRTKANVHGHDVVTVDCDNLDTKSFHILLKRLKELDVCTCVYSTCSSTETAPRVRVLIIADRTVDEEEYDAIIRKVAEMIGMDAVDPTTFDTNRLMFWPVVCSDATYVYEVFDGPPLDADGFLASHYTDWHNSAEWPVSPGEKLRTSSGKKLEDPLEKKGFIGCWNRAHSVREVAVGLLGAYEPVEGQPDRLTYKGGSSVAGAVLYDDGKFLHSFHATDPISGLTVNAFDLARIYLYGHLDKDIDPDTPMVDRPSYKAMLEHAARDPDTVKLITSEKNAAAEEGDAEVKRTIQKLKDLGAELSEKDRAAPMTEKTANGAVKPEPPEPVKGETEHNESWMSRLTYDKKGQIESTISNALLILINDKGLSGKIQMNRFSDRLDVTDALPWSLPSEHFPRPWTEADDAELRHYLESHYGLRGAANIDDAKLACANRVSYHPIITYLDNLKWDGKERLDTFLIDFFGADDSEYVRIVTRRHFTAAVARIYKPGCKYDTILVIIGDQGTGKSSALRKLFNAPDPEYGDLFADSVTSFEDPRYMSLLTKIWGLELGELDVLRTTAITRIKAVTSAQSDYFRPSYGHYDIDHPRHCVFTATSNNGSFLCDATGERRYWPVDTNPAKARLSPFKDLTKEYIDQLWAEAVTRYETGEPLYLDTPELLEMHEAVVRAHKDIGPTGGMIEKFVSHKVSSDWYDGEKWSIQARRAFWMGQVTGASKVELVPRTKICALDIWCELYNKPASDIKDGDKRRINNALSSLPGWTRTNGATNFGPYGKMRGFVRE